MARTTLASTWAQAVLECVPAEARVLMVRHGSTLQPRYAVSVGEAMSDMAMLPVSELVVYVEDELARTLLLRALPASIRQRVRVTTCGSWEDVIRFLATFRRDPTLGPVVALLDGDRHGKDAEHVDAFRRYLGGSMTENNRNWLTDRVHYLPGAAPPESYLRTLGTEPTFRAILAAELNADPMVVDEFFHGPLSGDEHSLAYSTEPSPHGRKSAKDAHSTQTSSRLRSNRSWLALRRRITASRPNSLPAPVSPAPCVSMPAWSYGDWLARRVILPQSSRSSPSLVAGRPTR